MQHECDIHPGAPPHRHCPFCRGAISSISPEMARKGYIDHAWHCTGPQETYR